MPTNGWEGCFPIISRAGPTRILIQELADRPISMADKLTQAACFDHYVLAPLDLDVPGPGLDQHVQVVPHSPRVGLEIGLIARRAIS
jgi:hypothetical protein